MFMIFCYELSTTGLRFYNANVNDISNMDEVLGQKDLLEDITALIRVNSNLWMQIIV